MWIKEIIEIYKQLEAKDISIDMAYIAVTVYENTPDADNASLEDMGDIAYYAYRAWLKDESNLSMYDIAEKAAAIANTKGVEYLLEKPIRAFLADCCEL